MNKSLHEPKAMRKKVNKDKGSNHALSTQHGGVCGWTTFILMGLLCKRNYINMYSVTYENETASMHACNNKTDSYWGSCFPVCLFESLQQVLNTL